MKAALARPRAGWPRPLVLQAVHIHHGLQAAADDWAEHCAVQCRQWRIPLRTLRVQVVPDGRGLEAAARAARYAALAALLAPGDLLVTAHHRDDQAETVLFRSLRGTGIGGLGAMRELEPLAGGQLWRPLLATPRAALRAYAQAHGLSTLHDPHNQDRRLARAFLRHDVMPLLQTRFAAADNLARLARHAQAAEGLLAELALLDAQALRTAAGFSVAGLLRLTPERRRNLLHHQWRGLGLAPPDADFYARLDAEVLGAATDATPALAQSGLEARRYRDELVLMRRLPPPPDPTLRLRWTQGTQFALPPGCGELQAERLPAGGVELAFAVAGLRLRPLGSDRTRTLRNLYQEAGLPVWVRQRMPLVFLGPELIAVGDRWRSAKAAALGFSVRWTHPL
ncbi:MAG TPA: tRNA lysidine(34) synthetase TilS, partial [Fontimonas sp.]